MLTARELLFSEIEVGDLNIFRRTFDKKDFKNFITLSGDKSPIHHKNDYAQKAGFENSIVPLHLYAAPVSGIIGMYLPGRHALILKTTISGVAPLYYDEEVVYSTKVLSKNDRTRVLQLRTLGFTTKEVILDVETLVKVRGDGKPGNRTNQKNGKSSKVEEPTYLLVTGATSQIGESIALNAARKGYSLILYYFSDEQKAKAIRQRAKFYGVDAQIRKMKVQSEKSFSGLEREPWYGKIKGLVHTYSSPLESDLLSLMTTNYSCLKSCVEELLPNFLEHQSGKIVNIGSSIVFRENSKYSDYQASKAASTTFTSSIDTKYARYGISACTLAPDIVSTDFSKHMGLNAGQKLLPEEVAEAVIELVASEDQNTYDYVWLTDSRRIYGRYGKAEVSDVGNESDFQTVSAEQKTVNSSEVPDATIRIKNTIANILRVEPNTLNLESGVTRTPGWDSLKHIEIIVEIEREFGKRFPSDTIVNIETISDIAKIIE